MNMRLVWTKHWAIKPKRYFIFRVGKDTYQCHFTCWHLALIEYRGDLLP